MAFKGRGLDGATERLEHEAHNRPLPCEGAGVQVQLLEIRSAHFDVKASRFLPFWQVCFLDVSGERVGIRRLR